MTIETMREFFGWCTLINVGILILSCILTWLLRNPMIKMHGRLFGVKERFIRRSIYTYLGNMKIAIIVLSLVPYLALSIMA